jgi:predicted cobalt transporter CbtA
MRDFAIASVATAALFWLTLGAVGGFLYDKVVSTAEA